MDKRGYLLFIVAAIGVAGAGATVAMQPITVALAGSALCILLVLLRLDWFQKSYVLTLVLMVGAASTIAPLASAAEYLRYVAAGLTLGVLWLCTRKIEPRTKSQLQSRVIGALWLVVLVAAASTIWSDVRPQTLQQTVALAMLVGMVHLLSKRRWIDRAAMVKDLTVGYCVLALTFIVSLAAGTVGYPKAYSFGGTLDTVGRFQGIYNNPNMLGLLAAITLPLGWGLYREHRRLPLLILVVPTAIVLLMSGSRTAILAAALALSWMLMRAGGRAIVKAFYLAGTVACVMFLFGWNPFGSSLSRFGKLEGGDVLNTRGDAWGSAISLFQQQPIGYGWGSGHALFESLQGSADFTFGRTSVHNSYLQVLLELGVFAILPMAYVVMALGMVTLRGRADGICSGIVGVIAAGLIVQITESAIFGTGQPYPYIVWFAVAGALTLYAPRAKQPQKDMLPAHYRQRFGNQLERKAVPVG